MGLSLGQLIRTLEDTAAHFCRVSQWFALWSPASRSLGIWRDQPSALSNLLLSWGWLARLRPCASKATFPQFLRHVWPLHLIRSLCKLELCSATSSNVPLSSLRSWFIACFKLSVRQADDHTVRWVPQTLFWVWPCWEVCRFCQLKDQFFRLKESVCQKSDQSRWALAQVSLSLPRQRSTWR